MIKHASQGKKMLKQFIIILAIILYASGCYDRENDISHEYSISDYTFDKNIRGILLSEKTDSAIVLATDYGLTNINVYTGKVDSTPLVWEYASHDSVYYFNYPISWRRVDGDDNNLISANLGNYYCYLYSMSADTAHLYVSGLQKYTTSNVIFKNNLPNGDELIVNVFGEMFLRQNGSSEWDYINVFDDNIRHYINNIVFDGENLLFSNANGEIRYLKFDKDVKGRVLWNSHSNNILMYKDFNNSIRVIIGSALYELANGELKIIARLNGDITQIEQDTIITTTGIYKDMIVSYRNGTFVVDNHGDVAIYGPDQYSENTIRGDRYAYIFDDKILVYDMQRHNIYEVIEEWPNKR